MHKKTHRLEPICLKMRTSYFSVTVVYYSGKTVMWENIVLTQDKALQSGQSHCMIGLAGHLMSVHSILSPLGNFQQQIDIFHFFKVGKTIER